MTAAYGEKIKAYLQRGARPLPGFDGGWTNLTGVWGAVCEGQSAGVEMRGFSLQNLDVSYADVLAYMLLVGIKLEQECIV